MQQHDTEFTFTSDRGRSILKCQNTFITVEAESVPGYKTRTSLVRRQVKMPNSAAHLLPPQPPCVRLNLVPTEPGLGSRLSPETRRGWFLQRLLPALPPHDCQESRQFQRGGQQPTRAWESHLSKRGRGQRQSKQEAPFFIAPTTTGFFSLCENAERWWNNRRGSRPSCLSSAFRRG